MIFFHERGKVAIRHDSFKRKEKHNKCPFYLSVPLVGDPLDGNLLASHLDSGKRGLVRRLYCLSG